MAVEDAEFELRTSEKVTGGDQPRPLPSEPGVKNAGSEWGFRAE